MLRYKIHVTFHGANLRRFRLSLYREVAQVAVGSARTSFAAFVLIMTSPASESVACYHANFRYGIIFRMAIPGEERLLQFWRLLFRHEA